MVHDIVIKNRKVYLGNPRFVQGGINSDYIRVLTDEEWQKCDTILVTFKNSNSEISSTFLLPGLGIDMIVPKSALAVKGDLFISFTGYVKNEVRLTTEKLSCVYCGKVRESGIIAGEGEDSHPDEMDYLSSLIKEVKDILDELHGVGGALDYGMLSNKPSIEGVILENNILLSDIGLIRISDDEINDIFGS